VAQMAARRSRSRDRIVNVSGGVASAQSLLQLTQWCDDRFGAHPVSSEPSVRAFDIPWIVLDASKAGRIWGWKPRISPGDS
jgi:CDP-paratose 2-epimerase